MKLNYEITKLDYIDFNINFIETSPVMKRSLFVQRFLFPLIYLAVPSTLSSILEIPFLVLMIIFGSIALLWIAFYMKWYKHVIRKKVDKLLASDKVPGIIGAHELTLGIDFISDNTDVSATRYNVVEKVIESPTHIFIYVSQVMAYIIPKHCFKDRAEIEVFLDALKRYIPNEIK